MTINNRIHHLSLHLSNQIAAGEVIERPASIVKELVENSIDAGASQIDISIEGAGSKLIQVHDNGYGIHADDLLLAIKRHTTSKLHSIENLHHIDSLGFRGEALHSISSVSTLSLTSRQIDSNCGWTISENYNGISPASHPSGTTIKAHDLFFNLPARRRFLRSNRTEQNHILTTIYHLSLSNFNIGFVYRVSAKNRLKLPISKSTIERRQRIAKICGQKFIDNTIYLEHTDRNISISGWLAKPNTHCPQNNIQYLFINSRVIRNSVISHAIRQAYNDMIPKGRYPAYILYLTIPPEYVDINVHPAKSEVRFNDARLIHSLITLALDNALSQKNTIDTYYDKKTNLNQKYISTQPKSYQIKDTVNMSHKHNKLPEFRIDSTNIIFYQRYIIIDYNHQPLLIDLQKADLQIRQQNLLCAIKTGSLKSRSILVPISVPTEEKLIAIYKLHEVVLKNLGIKFIAQSKKLLIKTIPSLLNKINIQQFVQAIMRALSEDKTSFEQLSYVLQQQLPLFPILFLEQAELVIQQIGTQLNNALWSKKLDLKTLNDLFYI